MRTHFLKNVDQFAVARDEKTLYAGNWGGQIVVVDVDDFSIRSEVQAHAGVITVVHVHPTLPYLATLSSDQSVGIWNIEDPHRIVPHVKIRLADLPHDDDFDPPTGGSQALTFHPTERRILMNASPGVAEVEFDDEGWEFRFVQRGYFPLPGGGEKECEALRYLPDGKRALLTSGGRLAVVDLAKREEPVLRWQQEVDAILHWAEHVEGSTYLLASDWRRVIRFDASGETAPILGPQTLRDDCEVVRYNKVSKKAYAASFDRHVYEIDPRTAEVIGKRLKAPFKLRGLATLQRDPDLLLVQCRNGALYKADLAQKKLLRTIKETPNATWTSALAGDDEIVFAGEGNSVLRAKMSAEPGATFATDFRSEWVDLDINPGAYTKRMVHHEPTKSLVLGRTDGQIVSYRDGTVRPVIALGSPLRDIDVSPEGFDLYATTEAGDAYRIDLESGRVLAQFHSPKDEPLWALAYNHRRRVLCVAERAGDVHFLDAATLALKSTVESEKRAKRIRWFDEDRLFVAQNNALCLVNVRRGTIDIVVGGVTGGRLVNTIEDFDWDASGQYLAIVTYDQSVYLCEMDMDAEQETVRLFSEPQKWDHGYVKGVRWLPPSRAEGAYPYEFVVYGRSGWVQHFRLNSERAFHVGAVNKTFSTPLIDSGVTVL